MYVRPYKHEPSALLEALDHIAPDPSDLKFTKRLEVVSMVLRGEKTTAQAAAESGFSLRSVQGWVRSVDENGWDSLRSAPPHGRPCRLSAAQLGEVRRAVRGDPCEKGYCWWSGTTVADYIRKTYGIEYGTGAALCLIKRLKLRPLMDARTSVGSDDSQQEAPAPDGTPEEAPAPDGTPEEASSLDTTPEEAPAPDDTSQGDPGSEDAPQDGAASRAPRWILRITDRKTYSADVTRSEFQLIRPFLESVTSPGPRVYDLYDIFCGCLYILKNGAIWADLPGDFPDWHLVFHYWTLWSATSEGRPSILEICMRMLTTLFRNNLGKRDKPSLVIIDAKSVKNVDTADNKGYDAGKKISGIKVHIAVDTLGCPIAILVTTANVTDRDAAAQMIALNAEALSDVKKLLFDGGYTGDKFANSVKQILPNATVEVVKRNQLHTFAVLPKRWIVERDFAWLDKCRRLWKNCEQYLETTRQMTILAFVALLLRRF